MAQRDFNHVLDDINLVEQRKFRQMGFTRGYSIGEEAGWRDGYSYGLRKGAQIAAEIGFYQGFVHAWIGILERDESSKQRKLLALRSLLELTRRFHRTNLHDEDCGKRLESIRAKFRQVNSLLAGSQTPFTTNFDDDLSSSHTAHPQSQPASQNSGVHGQSPINPHPTTQAHADFAHSKTSRFTSEMSF
ncbi:uncharacterized protein LOC141856196 [Brevipalpus obovatus]|uniref:uncharacterized protein LOC141856196 n=1 Tax=Brevipalpus obovatus TaxID=246614 RepID=UPI003D9F2235